MMYVLLIKMAMSNIMYLYRKKNSNNFDARCSNDFLTSELIVTIDEGKIVLEHPDLSYIGKVHKPCAYGNSYKFGLTSFDLQEGVYFLDEEESDIDKLVFKFNN